MCTIRSVRFASLAATRGHSGPVVRDGRADDRCRNPTRMVTATPGPVDLDLRIHGCGAHRCVRRSQLWRQRLVGAVVVAVAGRGAVAASRLLATPSDSASLPCHSGASARPRRAGRACDRPAGDTAATVRTVVVQWYSRYRRRAAAGELHDQRGDHRGGHWRPGHPRNNLVGYEPRAPTEPDNAPSQPRSRRGLT